MGEKLMAKFRKKARRAFRGFKRSAKRYGQSSNPLKVVIPAMAYGAGRNYLSNMLAPLTAKIPLGNYSDEAVFGILGYLAAKKGKGIIKDVGVAVLTVESASLGSQLIGSVTNNNSSSTGSW
jgi:hypothetical protein